MPIVAGYATVSPFNSNDTYLMVSDGWNNHFIIDLHGNLVVPTSAMPPANDGWFLWGVTSPSVFYYTNGNSLMKGTANGSTTSTTTVHQFTEYAAVNFIDETDVSQDGAHVVIVGGDNSGSTSENIFDYNFVTDTKGPAYTTTCTGMANNTNNSCRHKLIQTPDNNVLVEFAPDGTKRPVRGVASTV